MSALLLTIKSIFCVIFHLTAVHSICHSVVIVYGKFLMSGELLLQQRFTPADPLCQTPQVQLQFPEQDDHVPGK